MTTLFWTKISDVVSTICWSRSPSLCSDYHREPLLPSPSFFFQPVVFLRLLMFILPDVGITFKMIIVILFYHYHSLHCIPVLSVVPNLNLMLNLILLVCLAGNWSCFKFFHLTYKRLTMTWTIENLQIFFNINEY